MASRGTSILDTVDRQLNRWGNLVTLVAAAGAGISYLTGVVHQIKHFPLYAKIPLLLFGSLFVVLIALRLLLHLRRLGRHVPSPAPGYSIIAMHGQGGSASVRDSQLNIGDRRPRREPALDGETLRRECEEKAREIRSFLRERMGQAPEWLEAPRSAAELNEALAEQRAVEEEAFVAFQETFAGDLAFLWEELVLHGIDTPTNYFVLTKLHKGRVPDTATVLETAARVLSER
jgi:hypothetical protein